MHERQSINMDAVHKLIMEEGSLGVPVTFSDSTMILTPTTLARFEVELSDHFISTEAGSSSAITGGASSEHYWAGSSRMSSISGVDDDNDDDSSIDSNSNLTSANSYFNNNNNTTTLISGTSVAQSHGHLPNRGGAMKEVNQKPRKLPGPRPSRTLEEMTPLEAERRRRRRERNKNAAAKCRQRRVEQTNELLAETEQLEQESTCLEREIDSLRRMKNQLEFVLEAHKPTCTAVFTDVKPEFILSDSLASASVVRPNNLPISNIPTTCRSSLITSSSRILDGTIFSFDTPTTLAGLTPMLLSSDLMISPSSFPMSPSLIMQQ